MYRGRPEMRMAFQWASDQAQRSEAASRLKTWVRDVLQADDDLAISVSELDCAATACCGGRETIVALFWPDSSGKLRIPAPMEAIQPVDIMFAAWSAGLLPA